MHIAAGIMKLTAANRVGRVVKHDITCSILLLFYYDCLLQCITNCVLSFCFCVRRT